MQRHFPLRGLPRLISLSFQLLGVALLSLSGGCDEGLQSSQSPNYQIDPGQFVFPKQTVGATSVQEVDVRSIGNADLLISQLVFQRSSDELTLQYAIGSEEYRPAFDEAGEPLFNTPLEIPGGDGPENILHLQVTYTTEDDSLDAGQIVLNTNLPDERAQAVIPVVVSDSAPEISVTPTSLDFERVAAGEEKTLQVTITNIGQSALILEQIQLNGSQDFTPLLNGRDPRRQPEILEDPDMDGSPGLSPPDEESGALGQVTLDIRYTPEIEGYDEAQLEIISNDQAQRRVVIDLRANGETPCVNVLPAAIEFQASLVNRTDSQPLLIESCGGAQLEVTGIRLEDDGEGTFALIEDTLPELPLELPAAPPMGQRPGRQFEVSFTPREQTIYNGTIIIETNDPVRSELRVSLLGRGAENLCPQARAQQDEFYVLPLDSVVLDGTPSVDQDGPDNRPIEYSWVVTSAPDGSLSQPVESFFDPLQPVSGGPQDDVSTPTANFFIDLPGVYTIELRVRDQFGLDSITCDNPAVVTIVAQPDEAIHVQLLWESLSDPERQGADLDLHFLHPNAEDWFSLLYDCFFRNPVPDWGLLENAQDDPILDVDDIGGGGPENVTLSEPEDTSLLGAPYRVGVHYYLQTDRADGFDYGPANATVRIFINGELAWDGTAEGGEGFREMSAEGHFWEVATISWPDGVITTQDLYYEMTPGQ